MTTVIFYEKPGCANNARQKRLLEASGHNVDARDLLAEPWTAERLRSFFGERPVADWFNRAAPRVKSGEVVPERLDDAGALALMLADPLLIRRPLMEADGQRLVGFDQEYVRDWIGLPDADDDADNLEGCRRGHAPCPTPSVAANTAPDE